MPIVMVGPFFTPAVGPVTAHLIREGEAAVAAAAHRKVNAFQSLFFRYQSSAPTGHAMRSIEDRAMADYHIVQDNNAVYGPWLEGVGSRNSSTRFKGYWSFRRTTASMQNEATPIMAHYVDMIVKALS